MGSRALAAALVAAFVASAFAARSGTDQVATALVLAVATAVSGAACAWHFAHGGSLAGGRALLAALCVWASLVAVSLVWSANPDGSLQAAGRSLAYIAVAAAGVCAARRAPNRADALASAVFLGGVVVCAYGLAARVWPASLGADELGAIANRLGQPFGYWNALGSAAAMTAVAGVWWTTRPALSARAGAIGFVGTGIALLAGVLTQSRGAVLALAFALAIWWWAIPRRLATLAALAIAALAVTPVATWALSKPAFTERAATLTQREAVAAEFGWATLATVFLLALAGALFARRASGRLPTIALTRKLERSAAIATVALCAGLGLALAVKAGAVTGVIEQRVDELVSERAPQPAEGASRLVATSSTRSAYWREAVELFRERPLLGWGADSFEIVRLRHRHGPLGARHAHGFFAQQLADLGLAGVLVALAAFAASLPALVAPLRRRAVRTSAVGGLRDRLASEDAIAARAALALVVAAFGVQSLLDWTWYVPALALPALFAAGFLAGAREPRRHHRVAGGRAPLLAAACATLATLFSVWTLLEPAYALHTSERARAALADAQPQTALRLARRAADHDPLALDPLLVAARAQAALGATTAARRTLVAAVERHPQDPRAWIALARFEAGPGLRPDRALAAVRAALWLDPEGREAKDLYLAARARLRIACALAGGSAASENGARRPTDRAGASANLRWATRACAHGAAKAARD